MRIPRKIILIFTVVLFSVTPVALAAEQKHHEQPTADNGLDISTELKTLLNQEMAAIQKGMMALIPAVSAGEWEAVATIGANIKASFILKQQLTKSQKEELHRVLPPAFIAMDKSFHHSAGMLAQAAEMKNAEVVNFYFFKLTEACVSCHAQFATKRFPGLVRSADRD